MKQINIPISKFSAFMGYCEIQIINFYHFEVSPKVTRQQILGKKIHKELEDSDKLVPREDATEAQLKNPHVDLDFPRESIFVSISRLPFAYIGRIDKCIRTDGNIIIIDDKISKSEKIYNKPFPDRILQMCCYCQGFLDAYSRLLSFNKVLFRVVQRDTNGNVLSEYESDYDKSMKDLLFAKFQRFEDIYNKKLQPEHCNSLNKCKACSYFHGCKHRLE